MNSFDINQSQKRNSLQKELLLYDGDTAALFGILRRTRELDSALKTDEPLRAVRLSPFVEELCIAASFYLLPLEKGINFFNISKDVTVLLPVREFQRNFFFITSLLFKTNRHISVQPVISEENVGLVFEADKPLLSYNNDLSLLRGFSFIVKKDSITPVLRFARTALSAGVCPVDFSLLLCDKMSELNKWYFDIE